MVKGSEEDLNPHRNAFADFMEDFVEESDRAAVILGAAKIDFLLCQVLDKFLIPLPSSTDDLLEGDSPLGTFSARIKAAHRLGIIDDQFAKLLNTFRKLRNAFAHEVTHSSLSSGAARDRVNSMVEPFMKQDFFQGVLHKVSRDMKRDINDPGVLFRTVLAIFYLHLSLLHGMVVTVPKLCPKGIVQTCESKRFTAEREGEDGFGDT